MDSALQLFLDRFGPSSEAESEWLKSFFTFICHHLCPGTCDPAPSAGDQPSPGPSQLSGYQLSVRVLQIIKDKACVSHSLPVSYRLVSVSELLSQQHLACVSNLSWSTNQQREWAKEAELSGAGHRALPRVNLLLIGWLREGRGGEWKLADSSGSVRCELVSPSPLWLDRPVFLPHWNYIPHDASGQQEESGLVELIGAPVLLCAEAELGLAAGGGAEPVGAVVVSKAAGFLKNRVKGQRVSVYGQVESVCPLLVVAGSTFFFFTLKDDTHTLPVLVKDSRLCWAQCVRVGQSVCVTALRVCVLRGWKGNSVLCVTERSQLHTQYTHPDGAQPGTHTPADSAPSPSLLGNNEEVEPEEDPTQSAVMMKHSRVISYQGTVTEVVNQGAGLYVIDRTVGLCVAYQPSARRRLRAGDQVELHHVHFLYRPCADLPPSMLCCCLSSSLRVTTFSRLEGCPPPSRCPGDGVLPWLLLQNSTGPDQYLWVCHLTSQLSKSLAPGLLKQQCVCLLSWKLMETLWRRRGWGQRDIYSEMLDKPHSCPLTQYRVDPALPEYISISDLLQALQSNVWSLKSLLPPKGSGLTRTQINSALSWSCRTLSSDPQTGDSLRPRPLLLVGVLQLPSLTSEFSQTLQLRDATGAVCCVVTETSKEDTGRQTASFNTAWIGCLVCVRQFTMVTERALQSDFPSYQHLDEDKFITFRSYRVYVQFSLDHLLILSPSVGMVTHLRSTGGPPGGDAGEQTEEEPTDKKRREDPNPSSSSVTMATGPEGGASQPCVTVVIRVEQKEGVAWKNTGKELTEKKVGLQLCFSVRAAVIGPVVSWERDPKNKPMMEREVGPEKEKVILVFSGVCSRWFPLLQPGTFYRLVAANTQDPSVLIGCRVSGRSGVELHTEATLQVRSDWRLHTLTRLLQDPTCTQVEPPPVLSVSQVLDCSSELVCVQGQVCERVAVSSRTAESGSSHTGVRLTMCDQTGQRLQVYLDLRHAPYPPGLLPGNTLLLSGVQRKMSRCAPPPPVPRMHLAQWAGTDQHKCNMAQVKGHVACFLFLQLQWSCSQCGSVYSQVCRSQCGSSCSQFESRAKVVIEDGTGEAHVCFSGGPLQTLLGLADSQWEGLQRAVRVRGHVRIFPQGRSLVCDGDSDDFLHHFLFCVCSSDVMCRPIALTCRRLTNQRPEEVRRFTRGDREFMTRLPRPLQLTCVHLEPD
nr:CST complex subunit CTC1 isoform X2 [Nothobranchius furzeri]